MTLTPQQKAELAATMDSIFLKLAEIKATLLGYDKPVCSNRSHPHGPAGNCLSLP